MKLLPYLEKTLWPIYLIWSAIGLVATLLKVDEPMIKQLVKMESLQPFFSTCLSWGDFIFHALAAVNLLFAMGLYLGWKRTWISFAVIGLLSATVETIGARTGFPFGAYFYTDRMGPMIAETLPLAIPLAWWNILSSFFLLVRHFQPKLSPRFTCLAVAALATILDWIMEPFAWRIKGYWIWTAGSIPLQNYLAWFTLSFLLCRLSPMYSCYRPLLDKRIIAVPALMLVFFIGARIVHGV